MRPSRFLNEVPKESLHLFHQEGECEENHNTEFSPGDTVYHRDFGRGTIQKNYNTSLGLTYDVLFSKTNTTKSLVAKYAKLKASAMT